jgi:hypothetical protein
MALSPTSWLVFIDCNITVSIHDFRGQILSWIGMLSKLQNLSRNANSFTGDIPPSMSIYCYHGYMPNEFGHLYQLQHLSFQFMTSVEKSGHGLACYPHFKLCPYSVTTSLKVFHHLYLNISLLKIINLGYNKLLESIPSSNFNIPTLREIYFIENMVSGPMPSFIFGMSSMQVIDL